MLVIVVSLLTVLVLVQFLVLLELLRQIGTLRSVRGRKDHSLFVEGEGLPRGTTAPVIIGADARTNQQVEIDPDRYERSLVFFLSPTCVACLSLVDEINSWLSESDVKDLYLVALCTMPGNDHGHGCAAIVNALSPEVQLLFDAEGATSYKFNVQSTPGAALIERGIVKVHAIPNTREHISSLLRERVAVDQGFDRQREEAVA